MSAGANRWRAAARFAVARITWGAACLPACERSLLVRLVVFASTRNACVRVTVRNAKNAVRQARARKLLRYAHEAHMSTKAKRGPFSHKNGPLSIFAGRRFRPYRPKTAPIRDFYGHICKNAYSLYCVKVVKYPHIAQSRGTSFRLCAMFIFPRRKRGQGNGSRKRPRKRWRGGQHRGYVSKSVSFGIIHCLYLVGIWNSSQTIPVPCSSGAPSSRFDSLDTAANSPSTSSSVGMTRRISAAGSGLSVCA